MNKHGNGRANEVINKEMAMKLNIYTEMNTSFAKK
jgi:hypothetical protein